MGNLGWTEMFFIVAFALVIFGPRKLPEMARTLGRAVAQLRRASEEFKKTWEAEVNREVLQESDNNDTVVQSHHTETEASANSFEHLISKPEGTEPSSLLGSTDSGVKTEENRPVPIA